MDYYHKYKKYKAKYKKLKIKPFYFIHSTTEYSNLIDILRTGVIYPGKSLSCEKRKLCGDEPSKYVFANIYFEDLANISHMWDYSLLLHPRIMNDDGMIFNKGWHAGRDYQSIIIKPEDNKKNIADKFYEIRTFLKNPHSIPKIIQEAPGMMHHEVLFDHPIYLSNNLLAIICNYCEASNLDEINDVIKDKTYYNVPIYVRNVPFPKLQDLV